MKKLSKRYAIGDMVKRTNTRAAPFPPTPDRYYIVYGVDVDTSDNVWYTCFSISGGECHQYLLEDTAYRKYIKVA